MFRLMLKTEEDWLCYILSSVAFDEGAGIVCLVAADPVIGARTFSADHLDATRLMSELTVQGHAFAEVRNGKLLVIPAAYRAKWLSRQVS